MLRRSRRLLAGLLAALTAAPVAAVGAAGVAQADAVRSQELWVLNAMNVPTAWQNTQGRGVTVALIDSGVNTAVSDLAGSVVEGQDFTGVHTPPTDPHWGVHGTWMASLIVGHGHPPAGPNGIVGVAPQAHILSIRAVTDQGDPGDRRYEHESGSRVQNELADAIDYAAKNRVQVISMSLGYQGASRPVRVAIKNALAQGIVMVASSGNSGGARSSHGGNAPYSFPADYPGVLGVGAVGRGGGAAHFSSNNLSVEVAAPGVKVPAQGRDGQYWLVSGTSPACALTAGVAALIKSRYPALRPALVDQAITASAWHRPHGGYNEEVGFGTVNAAAALRAAARLVHDSSTGQGLAAAVRFGGGPSANPLVPVPPRGSRQLIIDIMLALTCLVLVAASAFWLIVTRGGPADPAWPGLAQPAGGPPMRYGPPTGPPAGYRPAGGPSGYGPPSGYGAPSGAPTGYGSPSGSSSAYGAPSGAQAGYGGPSGAPAGSGAPTGYAPPSGAPAGHGRPAEAPTGYGPPAGTSAGYGPPPAPSGDGPPAGTSAGYRTPSGPTGNGSRPGPPPGPPGRRGTPGEYGPPGGFEPSSRNGPPGEYRLLDERGPAAEYQPGGRGPADGYRPAGYGPAASGSGSSAGSGPSAGYGPAAAGSGSSAGSGPSAGYGPSAAGPGSSVGSGPSAGYRPSAAGPGSSAGSGPSAGYRSPAGHVPSAGYEPDAEDGPSTVDYGPAPGFGLAAEGGLAAGLGSAADYLSARGAGPSADYGPRSGSGPPAGSRPAAGYRRPGSVDPADETADEPPFPAGDTRPSPDPW